MSDSQEGFSPPEPFTMSELDPSGVLPDRVYSQEELRRYLEYCRERSRARIATNVIDSAGEVLFRPDSKTLQCYRS